MLHGWLATHTDHAHHGIDEQLPAVGMAGNHCHTDNLVAESPFDYGLPPCYTLAAPVAVVNYREAITGFYTHHHFFCELRGPPAWPASR